MFSGISFFADLGSRDLAVIDSSLPEAKYFLSYKPPLLIKDIPQERKSIEGRQVGTITLQRNPRAWAGNSYLLRVMVWEKADTAVAFQILRMDPDGSVTIAWKKLADFPTPFVLYMPDEELQEKVDAVIAEDHIICDEAIVRNNWLYFIVRPTERSKDGDQLLERDLNRRGIIYRGAGGTLP